MYAEWKQRVSATRRGGGLFLVGLLLLMVIGIVIARSSASSPRGLGPQVHSAALPLSGSWVPTALREQVTSLLLVPQQPSLLLAATTTGVWRSTDAGRTWQPDGTGLEGQAIFVLAGTPRGTGIWAGGFDGAVYERGSPVGGQAAWRRISPILLTDPTLGPVPVYSLAVSSQQGNALLAGGLGVIFRAVPSEHGRTWRWARVWRRQPTAGANPGSGAITSLLVAPWDTHLVYASVFGATPPIVVSHDGGRTWAPGASGLPALLPTQDLAFGDPHTQQIFLTTMGGGVWQRAAAGAWRDISTGLPQRHAMPLLAAKPADSGVLIAGTMGLGVYEKQGAGPWRHLGRGLDGSAAVVMGLAETAGAHPVLLVGTTRGVFRYVPGG